MSQNKLNHGRVSVFIQSRLSVLTNKLCHLFKWF